MSILLKIKTNASPCKHTVVTVTEDGVVKQVVFHDSNFEKFGEPSNDFIPDENFREIYKIIGTKLKGKKLSESKALFDGKTLSYTLIKEAIPL